MKTMGLSRLHLVAPKHFPDPDATARASGADDVLENARVFDTLEAALDGSAFSVAVTARRRDLSHEVHDPREAAKMLLDVAAHREVSLLFGTEMSGLTTEEIGKCQVICTIPANPQFSSLNLASAVQILAYELNMVHAAPAPAPELDLASSGEIEHFYRHLEETLIGIGFLDPDAPKRLMQRLRRLFSRTRLERNEVSILRGILRDLTKHGRE